MPCSFNCFLNKRFLLSKVGLKFKDPFVAACIGFTPLLAFALQVCSVQSTFDEYSFDTLCCIWILAVIWQVYHWLDDFLAILNEPAIAHVCLLSTRADIHLRNKQPQNKQSDLGSCQLKIRPGSQVHVLLRRQVSVFL